MDFRCPRAAKLLLDPPKPPLVDVDADANLDFHLLTSVGSAMLHPAAAAVSLPPPPPKAGLGAGLRCDDWDVKGRLLTGKLLTEDSNTSFVLLEWRPRRGTAESGASFGWFRSASG